MDGLCTARCFSMLQFLPLSVPSGSLALLEKSASITALGLLRRLSSSVTEPLWACDVFEKQALNTDKSGSGNYARFQENLEKFHINFSKVTIFKGPSTDLTLSYLRATSLPLFRFISIDGGHTKDITFSDLEWARCNLAEGGVIALVCVFN